MKNKTLANLIFAGFLGLSIGCDSGGITDTGLKEAVNTLKGTYLQDVDADGKSDIVYSTDIPGQRNWHVFYKRNLGNGEFDKPRFLYSYYTHSPGIPVQDVLKDEVDFYLNLVNQAKVSSKK